MLKRKVFKMKSSRILTLPSQVCDLLNIGVGDSVGVEVKEGKIVLTPVVGKGEL